MKIERREQLKAKMLALPQAIRLELRKALETSADEMADVARRFAPIDSGDLRASIGYTFGNYMADNANVRGVTGGGGAGDNDLTVTVHAGSKAAFYASFLEFGTVKMAAHPYFFPAYRLTKKRVKSRISRATTAAARKVAAG